MILQVLLSAGPAGAQERLRLFSKKLAAKTVERRELMNSSATGRSSSSSASNLELSTVGGVLWASRQESEFLSDCKKTVNVGQSNGWRLNNEAYEDKNKAIAQRLFAIRTMNTMRELIKDSTLEPTYRRVSLALKKARDYTTYGVVKGEQGKLNINQGEESERKRLVEFGMHLSPTDLVEPRIRLGDSFVLRHNPLERDTLFLFEKNF